MTRCGHGLRSPPFGEENDTNLRAQGGRLLDQPAAGESLIVRMRSEVQKSIRGVKAERIGHGEGESRALCGD